MVCDENPSQWQQCCERALCPRVSSKRLLHLQQLLWCLGLGFSLPALLPSGPGRDPQQGALLLLELIGLQTCSCSQAVPSVAHVASGHAL